MRHHKPQKTVWSMIIEGLSGILLLAIIYVILVVMFILDGAPFQS